MLYRISSTLPIKAMTFLNFSLSILGLLSNGVRTGGNFDAIYLMLTPAAVICEGEMLRTVTALDASSLNQYIPRTTLVRI